MMEWVFAGIALSAALTATVVQNMRRAILALWVAGLAVGALYLTLEAEFLAVVQWIVSTLLTLTFVFFAVMFGEFKPYDRRRSRNEWLLISLSAFLGLAFSLIVGMATQNLASDAGARVHTLSDLKELGQLLIEKNFVSLEVLALTLFLVLVGSGVVARSGKKDSL